MPRFDEYLAGIRVQIAEVGVDELRADVTLIDVRELDERSDGHIPDALHIPRGMLELRIEDAVPKRDAAIVVYCARGNRSALAAKTLAELGYTNVRSLAGGFHAWSRSRGAVDVSYVFTRDQRSRYARHTMLAPVGEPGQAKLLQSKVLIVGVGGLGSPTALYLAAAGVGVLGLVDDDVVDASNLQRQIIHSTATIGLRKVESAKDAIAVLNPDVRVEMHPTRLTADNALDIVREYDVIVDCTDNFATRYVLNDAALRAKKPVVSASIFQFEGQVTVLQPFEGPCYRCLYPEAPSPGTVPSCAEAGVLGVLPGVLGAVQATECIKLIIGIGDSLVGRLLHYDALSMRFREYTVERDPQCAGCAPGKATSALLEDRT